MNHQEEYKAESRSVLKRSRLVAVLLSLCLIGGLMIYHVDRLLDRCAGVDDSDFGNVSEAPDLSVSEKIPVTDSILNPPDSSDGNGGSAGTADAAKDAMPTEGRISRDYSGEGLAYSKTLNQYLSHKAVDITAPAGTAVIAVEEGTVIEAGADDRYGNSITLSHGDGLETVYSNLQDMNAAVGDVIKKGDAIGTVGSSSLFESEDEPHLHFEAQKDGEPIDPHTLWGW